MLVIIGWILCAGLVVKALELFSTSAHRKDEEGDYEPYAMIGGVLSLLAGIAFGLMLYHQADAATDALSRYSSMPY